MSNVAEHYHFLSSLKPAFASNAEALIFRPYLGSSSEWGKVKFSECEAHLTVVAKQRGQEMSKYGVQAGDVIGVWYASTVTIVETRTTRQMIYYLH